MEQKETIDYFQGQAARKFEKVYHGAQGVDVRSGDGPTGPRDLDGIPPRTYYASTLAELERAMPVRQFHALVLMTTIVAKRPLAEVGLRLCGRRQQDQAAAAATELVKEGLEFIVRHWGLK